MDYNLIWSSDAISDIEEIAEYIARDSVFYAESIVQRLYDNVPLTDHEVQLH